MARFLRTETNSSEGHSKLRPPPEILNPGIAFHGPRQRLVDPRDRNTVRRRSMSELRPPTAVRASLRPSPTRVYLADTTDRSAHNRRQRQTRWDLRGPVSIFSDLGRPIDGYLTRPLDRVPRTTSHLGPPGATFTNELARPLDGYLTKPLDISRRARAKSTLRPPAVVATAAVVSPAPPIRVELAASHRLSRRQHSRLLPVPRAFRPVGQIRVYLADIEDRSTHNQRQRKAKSRLLPVPPAFRPVGQLEVLLAPSRRGVSKSTLREPTDTVGTEDQGILATSLSYSLRGKPKSFLSEPAVVGPVLARALAVHMAYQSRRRGEWLLRPMGSSPVAYAPVSVTLAYSLRGKPSSFLGHPVVLDINEAFPQGPFVQLAPSFRGKPSSILREAVVVTATGEVAPTRVELVRIRPAFTHSVLSPPVDVTPTITPVKVSLAHARPASTHSLLGLPVVVGPILARPIDEELIVLVSQAYRPKVHSRLAPPVVVFPFVARKTDVALAYSRRGKPLSRLFPPIIPPLAPPVTERVAVQLTRARLERRLSLSRLAPPAVIDLSPHAYYLSTTLAYSLRGRPISFLGRPTDLVDEADKGSVQVSLVRIRPVRTSAHLVPPTVIDLTPQTVYLSTSLAYARRGEPRSVLGRPTDLVDEQDKGSTRIFLAQIRPAPVHSLLREPAVIDLSPQTKYISTALAYSLRGKAKSHLFPPTDLVDRSDLGALEVNLAVIRPVRTIAELRPPAVIDLSPQVYYLSTTLSYSLRGKAKSKLSQAVYGARIYAPIAVSLAASSRGKPSSFLGHPVVLDVNEDFPQGPFVQLAASFRGKPISSLRTPTIVAAPERILPTKVQLARIRPVRVSSVLRDPAVVSPVLAPRTLAELVRIRPALTHSALREPIVIDLRPQTYYVSVFLAPSRLPKPKSILHAPPAIQVVPKAETVIAVALAYSRRGQPKSELRPPVVIDLRPQAYYITVSLAPARRRVAKSRLLQVPAAFRPFAAVRVHLAPSRRPVAKSRLSQTLVARPLARPLETTLVRIRPARTIHFLPPSGVAEIAPPVSTTLALAPARSSALSVLIPPAVVGEVLAPAIRESITRIRPVRVYSTLRPPVIPTLARPEERLEVTVSLAASYRPKARSVLARVIYAAKTYAPISVTLAPQPKPKTVSFLEAPKIGAPVLRPISVTLAASRFPKPKSFLKKPSVVGEPERYFGPSTSLAYSRRGKPVFFLNGPTVLGEKVTFETTIVTWFVRIKPPRTHWLYRGSLGRTLPGRGDICGVDYPGTQICGFDSGADSRISGSDSAATEIRGATDAGSTISGTDRPATNVTGIDRKRS